MHLCMVLSRAPWPLAHPCFPLSILRHALAPDLAFACFSAIHLVPSRPRQRFVGPGYFWTEGAHNDLDPLKTLVLTATSCTPLQYVNSWSRSFLGQLSFRQSELANPLTPGFSDSPIICQILSLGPFRPLLGLDGTRPTIWYILMSL